MQDRTELNRRARQDVAGVAGDAGQPSGQPPAQPSAQPSARILGGDLPAGVSSPEVAAAEDPILAGRRLRVLVVDDHDVVHWGFRLMLGQLPWVERCISARNGSEAVAMCRRYEPHVAIVDLFLGDESGPEVCERLRAEAPAPRVLLISGAGGISPRAARAAGAAGFISKDTPASEIARLVKDVGAGKTVFMAPVGADAPSLTERESEILALIAAGATNREIAAALYLSPHTVKEHVSAVYRKLGVRNRAEAVQRSQRLGLRR